MQNNVLHKSGNLVFVDWRKSLNMSKVNIKTLASKIADYGESSWSLWKGMGVGSQRGDLEGHFQTMCPHFSSSKFKNFFSFLAHSFSGHLYPVSLQKVAPHAYRTRHTVPFFHQQFPWWAIKPSHYLLNAEEFNSETWIGEISNEMVETSTLFSSMALAQLKRSLTVAVCQSIQWSMWNVILAHLSPEKNSLKKYKQFMGLGLGLIFFLLTRRQSHTCERILSSWKFEMSEPSLKVFPPGFP